MNDDLKKIVESCHGSPHEALGPHRSPSESDEIVIRAFIPYASSVDVCIETPCNKSVKMTKVHSDGLFEAHVPGVGDTDQLDYLFRGTDVTNRPFEFRDAYSFTPRVFDPGEEIRLLEGSYSHLFDRFGARRETRNACSGVSFVAWVPDAQRVSVVGNFNRWDGRCHPMHKANAAGVWELFIPGVKNGDFYKFEIKSKNGAVFLKTDPYAFWIEDSPETAGIIFDLESAHQWKDSDWFDRRQTLTQSFSIFKVDETGRPNSSSVLAMANGELAELKRRGYSHIEIAGLCESTPEVAAFFSPNPHFGTPSQVLSFVDRCHRHQLGILIDYMPLSLAVPPNNLTCFNGGPLYEQPDKLEEGEFRFDTRNPGVKSFFLSYGRFWLENYHIDGFRLDGESHEYIRRSNEPWAMNAQWLVHEQKPSITIAKEVIKRLFNNRRLDDPFSILGPHRRLSKKTATIRAILPFAQQAYVYFPDAPGVRHEMLQICPQGLWQAMIPQDRVVKPYRLQGIDEAGKHYDFLDPYSFKHSYISDQDRKLFAEGNHYRIYDILGAHPHVLEGVDGVNFTVWAPNAAAVSVLGGFNGWDGSGHPMQLHHDSGIWELFVPAVGEGERYQFEIYPQNGPSFIKSDPYAFLMEPAPATESVVRRIHGIHQWQDQEWLERRRQTNVWRQPITIYEVHLASWMRGPGKRLLSFSEIADRLIPYVKEMGFTHIEILPIAEYPYEPSWGYQVSNFYAPTARLGKPEELMAFVDRCHQNGIGVLLDWVAGHFPKDAHALAKFDGTHLYEHEDPRKGEHKDWGTLIFNYGRHEAENFLIANALFWLEHYHFDGLRVDAVASMLYLDYSRKDGEWIPNIYGGNENLEAIEFLKHTNYVVHGKFPGVMMIAEESTAWAGVSRPTDSGGLGFGFKWNMGWMHDVLGYMQTPPEYRQYHHHRLAFVFHYAFEENFILSLSHDEVVHLKGSLYSKMPGCDWEKFANLRLLYFFMYTHPGKKLNFMGAEFAQIEEWSEAGELQWPLLDNEPNQHLKLFFKTLNELYCNEPVLYEMDCRPAGFEWIDANNHEQSIVVFSRKARDPRIALIIVINFSAVSRFDYRIGVPYPVPFTEILNSNDVRFGGLSMTAPGTPIHVEDLPWHGQEFSIKIDRLPALTAMLLKPDSPASRHYFDE